VSVKTKTFVYLALGGLSMLAVLVWYFGPTLFGKRPKSMADVRQTLEKSASEAEIQAEVDSLFVRFGNENFRSLYGEDLSAAPGLVRLGKALSGEKPPPPLWVIAQNGLEVGMPAQVRLRFGTHSHYQIVLFFRTGSDLSSMKSHYERVVNNVYFKP
jgi:hypothetical protein